MSDLRLTQPKTGVYTSEFWVTVLSVLGSASMGLKDVVSPKVSVGLIALSTAAYAIARGLAKR